eukprot:Sdes_comp20487_c0_seq2m14877
MEARHEYSKTAMKTTAEEISASRLSRTSTQTSSSSLQYEMSVIEQDPHCQDAVDVDTYEGHSFGFGALGTTFNLTNMILGSGIIGIPFAFRLTGVFEGLLLLSLMTYISDWTLRVFVKKGVTKNHFSYMSYVRDCFGVPGYILTVMIIFLLDFGSMISYLVVLGDALSPLSHLIFPSCIPTAPISDPNFAHPPDAFYCLFTDRRFLITLFSLFFILPVCFFRRLNNSLSVVSYFSIATVFSLISLLVARGITRTRNISFPTTVHLLDADDTLEEKYRIFSAIGILAFAFVCQDLSFFAYKSLQPPSIFVWNMVVHATCIISLVSCALIGILGYLIFGKSTQSNILNNFAYNDTIIDLIRIGLSITMIFTYPFNFVVSRDIILDAWSAIFQRSDQTSLGHRLVRDLQSVDDGRLALSVFHLPDVDSLDVDSPSSFPPQNSPKKYSTLLFVSVTLLLFSTSIFISLFADNLGHVQAFVGGVAGVCIAFLIPSMCILSSSYRDLYESLEKGNHGLHQEENNTQIDDREFFTQDLSANDPRQQNPWWDLKIMFLKQNMGAFSVLLFGVMVLVLCTLDTLDDIRQAKPSPR